MLRTSSARVWILLSPVAVIGLCGSCSSGTPGGGSVKANKTVGVSVLTLGNPFFRVIGDHLTAELEKAGYKAVVVAGEFDVAEQQQQERDFIVKKYAASVLGPCNSKGNRAG